MKRLLVITSIFVFMCTYTYAQFSDPSNTRSVVVDTSGNTAPVSSNTAFTDNLDSSKGLVTSSVMYGRVDNDTVVPINLDSSTQDIQIVEHEHAEIHGGDHYFFENFATVDSAASIGFCVQTPNTAKWTHLTWEIQSQGQIQFEIYENANLTYDGTDLTSYNNDRNSTNTSNWVNFEQDCTVNSVGTKLGQALIGNASNPNRGLPGGGQRNKEIILKQNEDYLFRITSGVNSNTITYLAEWYEHTNKN